MLFEVFDLHAAEDHHVTRSDPRLTFPIDPVSFTETCSSVHSSALDAEAARAVLIARVRQIITDDDAVRDDDERLQDAISQLVWATMDAHGEMKACFEAMVQLSRQVSLAFWEVCGDCYDTEGRLPYEPSDR